MQRPWLILLFIFSTFPASGAVYKWVDQTGEVHYSDQRVPGAERIELPASSVYTSPSAQPQPTVSPTGVTATAGAYENLSISSPTDDQTVHSNEQEVKVSINIQPPLAQGDRFRLFLDGAAVSGEHTATQITLQNVERGTHTLTVAIIDQAGKELTRSDPVTFYLRKISLLTLPGIPTPLPETPDSDSPDGEGEANGEAEEDGSEEGDGPQPDLPADDPYAPSQTNYAPSQPNYRPTYRPNYGPALPSAR